MSKRLKEDQSSNSFGRKQQPSKRIKKSSNIKDNNAPKSQPPYSLFQTDATDKRCEEGFASITNLLRGRKHVVVLAGAGISVSCGIPDFRSKGTGLYSTLDAHGLGLSSPEDLFDLEVFKEDPRPFYKFASKMLYPTTPLEPSISHRFLALLEEKKMLQRVYTQNIDGLEETAGVSAKRIVHAHGSLRWARCLKCRAKFDASEIQKDVKEGRVPRCKNPVNRIKVKKPLEVKDISRSSSVSSCSSDIPTDGRPRRHASFKNSRAIDEEEDFVLPFEHGAIVNDNELICNGVIKPGITFFGEKLGDKVRRCLEADRTKADALIVIGTSLSVAPMSKVIGFLPSNIPRILINRNIVKPAKPTVEEIESKNEEEGVEDFRNGYVFDACLLGFCDDVTRSLVRGLESIDSIEMGKNAALSLAMKEGKLLCNETENIDLKIRGLYNHPTDRVFLFPGAVVEMENDSDSAVTFKEVAHCDGCQDLIEGAIMKCTNCFDYDLCLTCYPLLSKKHFQGKHTFVAER